MEEFKFVVEEEFKLTVEEKFLSYQTHFAQSHPSQAVQ